MYRVTGLEVQPSMRPSNLIVLGVHEAGHLHVFVLSLVQVVSVDFCVLSEIQQVGLQDTSCV